MPRVLLEYVHMCVYIISHPFRMLEDSQFTGKETDSDMEVTLTKIIDSKLWKSI